jgi:predicted enzyme related to lactoylglutathione lyase
VVEAPYDIAGVGRTARIADPQGAELCPFRSSEGDPPDALAPAGSWCWNELHTSDPAKALAFYEKVFGFSHRSLVGPDVTYHILSRSGVERAGVTDHGGDRPHWLPYVAVDDADGTIARAKRLGATICAGPEDIPNVGRFGALQDPTGAALAILKPFPMEKKP